MVPAEHGSGAGLDRGSVSLARLQHSLRRATQPGTTATDPASTSVVKVRWRTGAAAHTARRLSADDLPLLRSATTSYEIFCPSLRLLIPARSTALMWTKTSLPPSSG